MNELERILEEVEKTAGFSDDFSMLPNALRAAGSGAQQFVQGMRNTADDHRAAQALHNIINNPQAPAAVVDAAKARLSAMPAHSNTRGLFRRMADEIRNGAAAAQKGWHDTQLQANIAQADRLRPVPPVPPAQSMASVASRATGAPKSPGFLASHGGKLLGLGALGLGAYSAYRASRNGAEQDTRATDYINNARHDATTPMPSMTVTASFDAYQKEVLAAVQIRSIRPGLGNTASKKVYESIGNVLATKLIADPVDALHKKLKKTYMDEPAWDKNFHEAVNSNPDLQEAYEKNPEKVEQVFNSIKRFGPTLAKDRLGTAQLLSHAMTADFGMDWNTLKAIAEIEKLHTESKRS